MEQIIKIEKISKAFPGVQALDRVSLELRKNEVLGLVGENGAGKSTLMKIIAGVYSKDSGSFILNKKEVNFQSQLDAQKSGIAMAFQELSLFNNLTIAENIFFGSEKKFIKFGQIDRKRMNKKASHLIKLVDIHFNPSIKTEKLSFSQKQMVEIAKALRIIGDTKNSVILFDEPTSLLNEKEIKKLFEIIRKLKKEHSVIFISHRLDEVMEISDHIYVFKDGKNVIDKDTSDTDEMGLHSLMVGKKLHGEYYKINKQLNTENKDVVFEIKKLTAKNHFYNCNFKLREGEILGLCGVEGSGKESLCRACFGLLSIDYGEIYLGSEKINIKSPLQAVKNGIGYIPEERLVEGISKYSTVADNINIVNLVNLNRHGIVQNEKIKKRTREWISKLNIKTPDINTRCFLLSGGNQQKIVLSKWLSAYGIKILILDHPTRGIDVGAKEEIYELIRGICKNGISIILTSDTLEELIGLSNSIYVLKDGYIKKYFPAPKELKPSQKEIVAYMV